MLFIFMYLFDMNALQASCTFLSSANGVEGGYKNDIVHSSVSLSVTFLRFLIEG